jgi:hypothetical protein
MKILSQKIRNICFYSILCLCMTSMFNSTYAAIQDDLWQKAVKIAEQNQAWVPGLVVTRTEELGKEDKVKHVDDMQVKLSLGEDGQIEEDVTLFKDGKEVEYVPKKEEKSEEKSNDSEEVSFKISADFWNPDVQKMMTVTVRDQRKDILGKTCVAHDFIQKITEKEHIKGTAWIEENTGIPVEVQFTQKPLPKHVKQMTSTIRYQYISESDWYPQEMLMEASGGFLFIKKRFRITTNFSNYWKAPPEVLQSMKQ